MIPGRLARWRLEPAPAAAPATTTPSPAYPTVLAAFPQASRPALPCGKPPAEGTRRLRSQNQFISSRHSQRSWCDHSKHEHAITALTRDYGVIATHAMTKISARPTPARPAGQARAGTEQLRPRRHNRKAQSRTGAWVWGWPAQCAGMPLHRQGRFRVSFRKWPSATLDRGASAPPPVREQGQVGACPDRRRPSPAMCGNLSQISHKLTRRYRTMASLPDT